MFDNNPDISYNPNNSNNPICIYSCMTDKRWRLYPFTDKGNPNNPNNSDKPTLLG